jgi:hypothetical protein
VGVRKWSAREITLGFFVSVRVASENETPTSYLYARRSRRKDSECLGIMLRGREDTEQRHRWINRCNSRQCDRRRFSDEGDHQATNNAKKGPAVGVAGDREDTEADTLARAPYWGNTYTWAADLDTSRTSAALADVATPNVGRARRENERHAVDAAGARRRAMGSVDGESAAWGAGKVRVSSAERMSALGGPP